MADVAAADPENAEATNSKKRPREPATAPLPDELSLPLSAIMRIVKARLPDGMMVGTDTKKAISKACSLFILYVSTIASDCAKENSRQTMNAQDILKALNDLEFDDFLGPVEAALGAFREAEKARSIEAAAKRAATLLKNGGGKDKDKEDKDDKEDEGGDDREE